ncbi:MAG TPA: phospholipid carrier-dependent glycosyltransferase, partial [Candidatus Polarisedimenticolia bacterium]|nr:phospholipid carrier-dependent glycosyltransferase [Candidatus Polarisedimenticolia bacterium]
MRHVHPSLASRMKRNRFLVLAAALFPLLLFLAEGAAFIRSNSQTSDEAGHLLSGYCYLARQDFRLNPEHPPLIKEISALPVYLRYRLPFDPDPRMLRTDGEWRLGLDFLYGSSVPPDRILTLARTPNLFLGACLVGLIGWWAYRLWGRGAALLALTLSALEPNLIAHACLVTTDLGAALFMCLALYLLWEYLSAPTWPLLVAIGIATGLALVTKFSTVLLLGILPVVIACHIFLVGRFTLPEKKREGTNRNLGRELLGAVTGLLLLLSMAALVIPSAYFFQGFSAWGSGFLRLLAHQAKGHPAFFLGSYSDSGWWTYFLVAFLIKTPLGSLLLILASLLLPRAGRPLQRREAIVILIPVTLLFAATSWARIDIGLRH